MRLCIIGFPTNPLEYGYRGQIEVNTSLIQDTIPDHDQSIRDSQILFAHFYNIGALFPGINVIMGIIDIGEAIFYNGANFGVMKKDILAYKTLKLLVGIAELTLIGGWIVHGIAALYFHFNPLDSKRKVI